MSSHPTEGVGADPCRLDHATPAGCPASWTATGCGKQGYRGPSSVPDGGEEATRPRRSSARSSAAGQTPRAPSPSSAANTSWSARRPRSWSTIWSAATPPSTGVRCRMTPTAGRATTRGAAQPPSPGQPMRGQVKLAASGWSTSTWARNDRRPAPADRGVRPAVSSRRGSVAVRGVDACVGGWPAAGGFSGGASVGAGGHDRALHAGTFAVT